MIKRDRRKIEACPYNTDVLCRTATLVMNLTRSLRQNDGWMKARTNWVKVGRIKYALVDKCESCIYNPESVDSIIEKSAGAGEPVIGNE